jgi:hypothetical protein
MKTKTPVCTSRFFIEKISVRFEDEKTMVGDGYEKVIELFIDITI